MKKIVLLIAFLAIVIAHAQEQSFTESEIKISDLIEGNLIMPNNIQNTELVIIIAGSGPTNRNGNQNFLKSDNLKKIALSLAEENIASFRYDKRIIKQIRTGNVDVKSMRFEDIVLDAKDIINHFSKLNQFTKIYIAGHSQGSLVGMLAINEGVDGFISIAGAGQNIGDVIVEQINNTARQFVEETKKVVTSLKAGKSTEDYPPALAAMFNTETQPFMMSWMAYEPTEIIAKLKTPILIVNGTKDLQVSVEEAKLLAGANTNAELKVIENMNHVLFTIEGDRLENSKSYNEAFREINSELIDTIVDFIKNNR